MSTHEATASTATAVADSPSPAAAAATTPVRQEVDRLILPTLRERVRDSLWFLALSQSIYAVTLLFSQGEGFVDRAFLNVLRVGTLFVCVWALRGPSSRERTLAIAAVGLAAQFGVGVAISIVRKDVVPMAMLTIALTCVTSVLLPWGARAQAVLSSAAALSMVVASLVVYRQTGTHIGFDPAATVLAACVITVYIAHFLDRSRRSLEGLVREARRTDAELAELRVQLERRVTERTSELEMANRELEGFSYTVSHDLRSPLRTISGFSQVILEEQGNSLPETVRTNLVKIRTASQRMDELIDDMLLLARVGRSALRYEMVDLAALARTLGAEIAAEHPGRQVELDVSPIPIVPGDHALLRIALDNLLRNAWKFSDGRSPAHVRVTGERRGRQVVVRVSDDGIGFDARFRHKLFQPFERIHSDPRFPGTGVGLATVARIVRRHGGEVEAEGELGAGATFSMVLPAMRIR